MIINARSAATSVAIAQLPSSLLACRLVVIHRRRPTAAAFIAPCHQHAATLIVVLLWLAMSALVTDTSRFLARNTKRLSHVFWFGEIFLSYICVSSDVQYLFVSISLRGY